MAALAYLAGDEMPAFAACTADYDPGIAKVQDLAGSFLWPGAADAAQVERARMEVEDAFQACVAADAPRQPAYGKILARAESLLATMRTGMGAP